MALTLSFALDAAPSRAAVVLAFVLTYLLHSVIWCAGAALAARSHAFAPSTQRYIFLAALLGPIVTSTIAVGARASGAPLRGGDFLSFASTSASSPAAHGGGAMRSFIQSSDVRLRVPASSAFESAASGIFIALLAASVAGALKFLLALAALQHRLRHRIAVDDRRILDRLHRLRERAGLRHVALTQTAAIDVPLVLGRSEICLPAGSSSAPDAEIDAMLAHELGHIIRGDGIIFPLVSFVQSVGWCHPLHQWTATRFKQAAELACDDWSVELTGDPLALAHALTRVAHGALLANGSAALPAMARPHAASVLLVRVRRLVGEKRTIRPRLGRVVACCGALAVLTIALSVRAAGGPRPLAATFAPREAIATATEQIGSLMERAEQLELESEPLQRRAAAGDRGAEARLSELQQQLRHVRETAAWIERAAAARE